MNNKGKNNPNYKHGKCCTPNYCMDCGKEIDKMGRSKRCPKCNIKNNNPFKNKKHTKKTKLKIGIKSKAKWTKKYKAKIKEKHQGNKKRAINGYILIKDYNHPNKNSHNDMLEHRLIMEGYLGRYLTAEEIIHHINYIKNDNRIKNLYLYSNRSEHLKANKSLNELVDKLLKLNIIKFKKGRYEMNKRRTTKQVGGKNEKIFYF